MIILAIETICLHAIAGIICGIILGWIITKDNPIKLIIWYVNYLRGK